MVVIWIYVCFFGFYFTMIFGKPAPEPWYGDFIGELDDMHKIGLKGHVYIVNDTCLQLIDFTYKGNGADCRRNMHFWMDHDETLTSKGIKLLTFEYGSNAIGRYENDRVVLSLPLGANITHFSSFGLWCQSTSKNYGYLKIPKDLKPPRAIFLDDRMKPAVEKGPSRYKMSSGPILIMDRRTIKVYGFSIAFSGDLYFVVGKGDKIIKRTITKVPIRGDIQYNPIPKHSRQSNVDFIIDLPEEHDIYNIDWLAIWCGGHLNQNFGQVFLKSISDRVPPYVPTATKFSQHDQPVVDEEWPKTQVSGTKYKNNFTFQLGVPGGQRAYVSWMKSEPARYVWYVNGLMAPELWLEKDVTYNFIIEGGDDTALGHLYNPLYISNDSNGGYSKISNDDRKKISVYAGLNSKGGVIQTESSKSYGSACVWLERIRTQADNYESFSSYRTNLMLKCLPGKPGQFQWTPSSKVSYPAVIYYQSYTEGGMGGRIYLVDDVGVAKDDSIDGFTREQTTKDKIPFGPKKLNEPLSNVGADQTKHGVSFLHNNRRWFYLTSFILALLML